MNTHEEYQSGPLQDAIMGLHDTIQELVDGSVLLLANGQSLQSKLQDALNFLAAGDMENARGAIGAFTNQVKALLKTGKLTQNQADSLLAEADAIKAMLT